MIRSRPICQLSPAKVVQADHQEQIPDHDSPRVTETRFDSCRGHGCDVLQ